MRNEIFVDTKYEFGIDDKKERFFSSTSIGVRTSAIGLRDIRIEVSRGQGTGEYRQESAALV